MLNYNLISHYSSFYSFTFPISMNMKSLLVLFYDIVFFLIIIFLFVSWILGVIIYNYTWKNSYLTSKDSLNINSKESKHPFYFLGLSLTPVNHFFLEFVWTTIPIIIFFLLFIPLLKLLRTFGFNDFSYWENYDKNDNWFSNDYYTYLSSKFIYDSQIKSELDGYSSFDYCTDIDLSFKKFLTNNYLETVNFEIVSSISNDNDLTSIGYKNCKFTRFWDREVSFKVIGNQWYWMYEKCQDFYGLNYYEEGVLFSYMLDVDENTYIAKNESGHLDTDMVCGKYFNNKDYLLNGWVEDIRLLSVDNYLCIQKDFLVSFFITSYDVIHSWSIPSAGIKVDACPGRIASSKISFLEEGFYYGQCSELCGFLHGFMPICIRVWSNY